MLTVNVYLGLFLLMLYNTLHPRRYLGRPFIMTMHSLEGLMIIDSLLIFLPAR